MNDLLLYFFKVNIAIALFYLFYRLAFYNDTFWATRRYYLVFSILLSVVYPFISLSGWLEKQETMQEILASYVQLNEITVTATQSTAFTMEKVLLAAYGIVCAALLIKMIVQLASIVRWKLKGKRQVLNGIEIIAIDGDITPFSFLRQIFLNPSLHNEYELFQILTHESTHAHQYHSLDVILGEMLTITCWMNPAAWLLRHEIRNNLEYIADNSVLQSGMDSRSYQYHLLQLSYRTPEINLINKFNVSPLRKRITMMNQEKTHKASILKYTLIVPLALALVLSSNVQTLVASAKKALTLTKNTEVIVNSKENNVTLASSKSQVEKPELQKSDNKDVYEKVEKMPVFPGGENGMMKYLANNIKYPAEAKEKGIQGRIILRFIVNKMGKIEKTEIIRGLDPSCDNEALRVVNSMPLFTPGEQNGKKVSVYYTLPITFKLDNSKPDIKTTEKTRENWIKSLIVLVDGIQQPIGFDYRSIKQEDIESINVLKTDTEEKRAELVAKYGENANPGVIVITKKK